MKVLFISLLTFISISAFAQDQPTLILPTNDLGEIIYTEAITLDSAYTKQTLYSNAIQWTATFYNSSGNVIKNKDPESGVITIVALTPTGYNTMGKYLETGYFEYTLMVYVKNGRYKYEIKNMIYIPHGGNYNYGTANSMYKDERPSFKKVNTQMLSKMDAGLKALISSLNKSMRDKANTEW